MENEEKKREKQKEFANVAVTGANAEIVQRYGAAVKEHLVSYSGTDNEAGKELKKSLKSIADSKVNPNDSARNLKQQAGYAAEVKKVAKDNAEAIINGDSNRTVRTDDIGRVNDPLYDHVKLDGNGNIIDGSGTQMKFVKNTPEESFDKLTQKKYDKYRDNNTPIEVPSDYYQKMIERADERIADAEKQLKKLEQNGKVEEAAKKREQIEKLKKTKANLRKGSVSSKEAKFAREHPELSTAMDVTKVSFRAGLESMGISAAIGSSISLIRNVVSACQGEIDGETAALNVAKDTAGVAAVGFGTAFAGSMIKGGMQNATNEMMRGLSQTNLPAVIVNGTLEIGRTLVLYFQGEIDGAECLEQLGEKGYGGIASAAGAFLGTAIPIPVIGPMIGSIVGYAIASASYGLLLSSLKEAKLAHEERLRVEAICAEHIKLIREYRAQLETMIADYLQKTGEVFHEAFDGIKSAWEIGDVDGFISGANKITAALGKEVLFETQEECDKMMLDSDLTIVI